MSSERLLQRFLKYVRIKSTAALGSTTYPSSASQFDVGKVLVAELRDMGLADVEHDAHGLVWATLPGNVDAPTIAFNAHVDTYPESAPHAPRPQVIRDYAGGDITLTGDPRQVIRVADNPELATMHGKTLVTTDGTTLLGADDKAGVAAIMEAVQRLAEQPDRKHGPIRVLFTCDEELGHGVDHVDLNKLAAIACYTLDGSGAGELDVETFSADLATVTIHGVSIHTSIAKGRMVNALRVAATFLNELPAAGMSPETTADREGFLHPDTLAGDVSQMSMRILLRDFDAAGLTTKAQLIRDAAARAVAKWPGAKIDVAIEKQYRNLGEGLAKEPRAKEYALAAYRQCGIEPKQTIIRGGTDGSRFTELGLPTPNLSTGEHNPHSLLEWTCLEEMEQAVQVVMALCDIWARGK